MIVGSTLSAKVQKRSSKKVGEFYAVLAVLEVKPPTDGEVIDAEIVEDKQPDQEPIDGLNSLFDNGVVTTANKLPKRRLSARSLHSLSTSLRGSTRRRLDLLSL